MLEFELYDGVQERRARQRAVQLPSRTFTREKTT